VPFEEDERDPKTWFLDLDYVESMWEMFRKVNGVLKRFRWCVLRRVFDGRSRATKSAKERPVGFYHTGPQLRSSDLEISERLKRFMPRPVSRFVHPIRRL
jgi:26S proteasome regulatory subunit N8